MLNVNAKRSALKVIGAAAVIGSGLLAADASANLKIELVAVSATGGATVSADGKTVSGATAGTVVSYKVVCVISGPTVTNPGVQSAAGGIYSLSGAGVVNGNLTHANAPLFATGAFLNGTSFTDANGATQWGPATGPTTVVNSSPGRISYLASSVVGGTAVTFGTGTYTVTSVAGANSTSLSFKIGTTTTTNKNPLWREVGTSATFNASTGVLDAAAPLVINAGSVSSTPTLTLTAAAGVPDLTVGGIGNGSYIPTAISFPGLAAGSKNITFTVPNPGTVLVGLDLNGSSANIADLITALNAANNPSGVFFGLGGGGAYDAIATFTGKTGGSFTLAWANFGNVTLQGIAVVPEPTSAAGLLGVAALAARRRRA